MPVHIRLRGVVNGLVLAAVVALVSACGSHVYHQVRKGDTLYSVSWRYHQDYHQVAQWNGISPPYIIHEGQWIRVAPPKPDVFPNQVPPPSPGAKSKADKPPNQVAGKSSPYSPPHAERPPRSNESSPRKPPKLAPRPLVDPVAWLWPVEGPIVHRFNATAPGKKGIDIAGARGAAVRAAAAGRVVYSGDGLRGYGNLLIVKHSDRFLSAYAHNRVLLVKEGEHVVQGQTIAEMGSTEIDRVLLHFEIRLNGKPVDPLHYLPKRGT